MADIQPLMTGRSGEERARRKYAETSKFLARHPEYTHNLGALLGTVTACRQSGLHLPSVPLEDAHTHVFGDDDKYRGCQWCKRNYEMLVEEDQRFYNRVPPGR